MSSESANNAHVRPSLLGLSVAGVALVFSGLGALAGCAGSVYNVHARRLA